MAAQFRVAVLAGGTALMLMAGLATVVTRSVAPSAPTARATAPTATAPGSPFVPAPSGLPSTAPDAPSAPRSPRPANASSDAERPDRVPAARGARPESWMPGADGKPGYGDGFAGCAPASLPVRSRPPARGLRFDVYPVVSAVRPGDVAFATAVVTNTSDRRVAFDLDGGGGRFHGMLLGRDGAPRSGIRWNDAIGGGTADLRPGESATFDVIAQTIACGDVPGEDVALPPGDYRLVVAPSWYLLRNRRSGMPTEGDWVSRSAPLRIDERAPEPPCRHDGTMCYAGLPYARPPGGCSEQERSGADYGATRDLELRVELDSREVPAGEYVDGRAVVTNVGSRPHWLRPEPQNEAMLRGAGGPLGPGSGLLGGSGSVAGARRPVDDGMHHFEIRRIDPGESISVRLRAYTETCSGEPLTSGDYYVRTGVYVIHFGWWPAPEVKVRLTG